MTGRRLHGKSWGTVGLGEMNSNNVFNAQIRALGLRGSTVGFYRYDFYCFSGPKQAQEIPEKVNHKMIMVMMMAMKTMTTTMMIAMIIAAAAAAAADDDDDDADDVDDVDDLNDHGDEDEDGDNTDINTNNNNSNNNNNKTAMITTMNSINSDDSPEQGVKYDDEAKKFSRPRAAVVVVLEALRTPCVTCNAAAATRQRP
jgi:uncharacterized protein (DUF2147 family)